MKICLKKDKNNMLELLNVFKNYPELRGSNRRFGTANSPFKNRLDQSEFDEVLDKCRALSSLKEGWCEDGLPITSDTIERAINFLSGHIKYVQRYSQIRIPLPKVGPVSDGSIDLYWKTPKFRFLVNIPGLTDEQITFSGERDGKQKERGSVPFPSSAPKSLEQCDLLISFLIL